MTWSDNPDAKSDALERLRQRFPGSEIKISAGFDIATVGLGPSRGALILRDGVAEIVIVDREVIDEVPDIVLVENQLVTYVELLAVTRSIFERYRAYADDRE